jgi:hypothetical protein
MTNTYNFNNAIGRNNSHYLEMTEPNKVVNFHCQRKDIREKYDRDPTLKTAFLKDGSIIGFSCMTTEDKGDNYKQRVFGDEDGYGVVIRRVNAADVEAIHDPELDLKQTIEAWDQACGTDAEGHYDPMWFM